MKWQQCVSFIVYCVTFIVYESLHGQTERCPTVVLGWLPIERAGSQPNVEQSSTIIDIHNVQCVCSSRVCFQLLTKCVPSQHPVACPAPPAAALPLLLLAALCHPACSIAQHKKVVSRLGAEAGTSSKRESNQVTKRHGME